MSRQLEIALCRIHQRRYCHLVGNATAGLYLSFRAHDLAGKKVAAPNSVCPNVPFAIYLAEAEPVFLDISPDNLGLNPDELVNTPDVAAVVAVHAYGVPSNIAQLEVCCAKKGVVVIEDAAVAQGVTIGGRPAGSFGSVSIVSFGVGKIVDVGGGGAVLTDDLEIYRAIVDYDAQLPQYNDSFGQCLADLSTYHTHLYNSVYLKRRYSQLPGLFNERAQAAISSFLHRFDTRYEHEILLRLERLPSLIQTRRDNSQFLCETLCGFDQKGIRVFDFPAGSVPWRFNLLLERCRDQLLRVLIERGLRISSWYPSVDVFFAPRPQSDVDTPVSDNVSDTILNIWVDESVDEAYLKDVSQRIIQVCSA